MNANHCRYWNFSQLLCISNCDENFTNSFSSSQSKFCWKLNNFSFLNFAWELLFIIFLRYLRLFTASEQSKTFFFSKLTSVYASLCMQVALVCLFKTILLHSRRWLHLKFPIISKSNRVNMHFLMFLCLVTL